MPRKKTTDEHVVAENKEGAENAIQATGQESQNDSVLSEDPPAVQALTDALVESNFPDVEREGDNEELPVYTEPFIEDESPLESENTEAFVPPLEPGTISPLQTPETDPTALPFDDSLNDAARPTLEQNPNQRGRRQSAEPVVPILTQEIGGAVETQQDKEDVAWHDIRNSQISGRPLSGILGKIEWLDSGTQLAIVMYKGIRVAIPLREMMINLERPPGQSDNEYNIRVAQVLNRMVGAEIDFIVRGTNTDGDARAAVASRKAAMIYLRRRYYLNIGANGKPQIYPGRVVEARIVSVSETAIRIEAFGVEATIYRSYLSWGNVGDVRDQYFVGDTVPTHISSVIGDTPENIRIRADLRSLIDDDTHEKLAALKPQTNCLGTVTDVNKGVVLISLIDGVRAISHRCLDPKGRKPGRGDQVMFIVTRIEAEGGYAVGLISRIVKRNI